MIRTKALTIIEILVASSLLLLLMALVSVIVLGYLRAYRSMEPNHPSVKSVAFALEHLTHDLRSGVALYCPDEETMARGYRPVWGESSPLIVAVPAGQGVRVIGLALDPADQVVRRIEYAALPTPDDYYPDPSTALRLGDASDFRVQLDRDGHLRWLRVRLTGEKLKLPFETIVRFRASAS